jgi:hypothetical protein
MNFPVFGWNDCLGNNRMLRQIGYYLKSKVCDAEVTLGLMHLLKPWENYEMLLQKHRFLVLLFHVFQCRLTRKYCFGNIWLCTDQKYCLRDVGPSGRGFVLEICFRNKNEYNFA